MASKVQRVMTQPINLIFRFLQNVSRGVVGVAAATGRARQRVREGGRAQRDAKHALALCAATTAQKSRIQVWLYEQTSMRLEGRIIVRARAAASRDRRAIVAATCRARLRPAPCRGSLFGSGL
jgi:hypothetical protein